MPITPLMPRQAVPDVTVPLVGGGTWTLSHQTPKTFTMLVVYRGLHCPICKSYLADLQRRLPTFEGLGVGVLAVSSDPQDRAEQSRNDWGLDKLPLAYGLTLQQGRSLGLYVSSSNGKTSIGVVEPDLFVEPGLFLIRPDRTLYFGSVQTMPFARPQFAEIEGALKFVIEKNYPARGEVVEIPA
ncbi:MAG: peroxiredoxin-like family protein [Hyphomicrobiaceae bacterium]